MLLLKSHIQTKNHILGRQNERNVVCPIGQDSDFETDDTKEFVTRYTIIYMNMDE